MPRRSACWKRRSANASAASSTLRAMPPLPVLVRRSPSTIYFECWPTAHPNAPLSLPARLSYSGMGLSQINIGIRSQPGSIPRASRMPIIGFKAVYHGFQISVGLSRTASALPGLAWPSPRHLPEGELTRVGMDTLSPPHPDPLPHRGRGKRRDTSPCQWRERENRLHSAPCRDGGEAPA
jgi:hypothetical protein